MNGLFVQNERSPRVRDLGPRERDSFRHLRREKHLRCGRDAFREMMARSTGSRLTPDSGSSADAAFFLPDEALSRSPCSDTAGPLTGAVPVSGGLGPVALRARPMFLGGWRPNGARQTPDNLQIGKAFCLARTEVG